jgi:hypothetical protein
MERLEFVTNHFAFSLDHGNHLWPGIIERDEIDHSWQPLPRREP